MKKYKLWGLLLACVLVLPACWEGQRPPEDENNVLIYAALNPIASDVESSVKRFNASHEDVQIEIHDYSNEGGLDRLRIELALGQVPDIMEMHYLGTTYDRTGKNNGTIKSGNTNSWKWTGNSSLERPADEYWMPYRQMAQKGYLEDLWPYIEKDPQLGRDGVLMPPLKAAEVNGGLYLLFMDVRVTTLMGPESIVGDRYSWTLEELLETFSTMREDSTILQYNATKQDVFDDLICFTLEKYVDRSTGECTFDSEEFLDLVAFLECFPDEVDFATPQQVAEERMERVRMGRQMLEVTQIPWPEDLIRRDGFWGERTAFPGYPTVDGSSGSFFYPMGNILSMSSTCRNKEAAWEYIRELIKPVRTDKEPIIAFVSTPVNLHDYELFMWGNLVYLTNNCIKYSPQDPLSFVHPWTPFPYGPAIHPMALLTEEDGERFQALIDHTTRIYWPEDDLSDIVWETLGAYFAGDRTLDDTIRLIDNRVGLYLKEQQ